MSQEFKPIIFLLPKFTFKIQEEGITLGENPAGLKVAPDKRHSIVMLCSYSGAPPAREARERGRSPIAKEMW